MSTLVSSSASAGSAAAAAAAAIAGRVHVDKGGTTDRACVLQNSQL